MFVQLLNQNATNTLEKTRRFMAFQVSVTHRFLLTPFCQQQQGWHGGRGGCQKGTSKSREWPWEGAEKRGRTKASHKHSGWWGNLHGNSGQKGHGKSPIPSYSPLGIHLHLALPPDQSDYLNFLGPTLSPSSDADVLKTENPQSGDCFTSRSAPSAVFKWQVFFLVSCADVVWV